MPYAKIVIQLRRATVLSRACSLACEGLYTNLTAEVWNNNNNNNNKNLRASRSGPITTTYRNGLTTRLLLGARRALYYPNSWS